MNKIINIRQFCIFDRIICGLWQVLLILYILYSLYLKWFGDKYVEM